MPIGSDFTLDYTDKTITHTSGTAVYQMYELYAWLMDQVDESGTIDDPIPMTAQTPTAFTLTNGWFIDYTSTRYLTGGSLKTDGWDGGEIVMISYNASTTAFDSGDIGQTITGGTTGDTGTVLFYDNRYGGNLGVVWIRADVPGPAGDAFDNATETFTVSGGGGAAGSFTGTFYSGGGLSGETIWANPFTLGTLVANTKLYISQDNALVTAWWGVGQIDILIAVQEAGILIDEGTVTVYARQYSKLYDHFVVDLSSGARTPVPLATFADGNNLTGYRQMVLTDTSGNFVAGEVITDNSDSTLQGVITLVSGTTPNNTIQYYLVNSLADFAAGTGTFTGSANSFTATAVNSTAVGPAGALGITITFGATTGNLNNGNGARPYDVTINCNNNPIEDVYEYLKYVTRQGSTTALDFPGTGYDINGDLYAAVGEYYLTYGSMGSGTFSAGTTITGGTSGATGYIVSDHTSQGALVVTDVVGTFVAGETISQGGNNATIDAGGVEEIAPNKQAPFGSFAGGKFFGARGVWLTNVPAADANDYQLIDSTGTNQTPPQTIAITINNTVNGDRVAVFPTTGDNEIINKSQYTSHATNNSATDTTFEVVENIESDTPTAGYIRVPIRNASGTITGEDRYQYDSWSGKIFTLNAGNTLLRTYDSNDTAYVPYVDMEATTTSVSQSITYAADRFVLTVVRNTGMIPFKIKGQITTNGLTVQTIRTDDTVYQ